MKKKRRNSSRAAEVASRVNAQLGIEVIGFASDPRFIVERLPTGSLVVDRIMGGGLPRGRHVEFFGDYHGGKSTVAYLALALAQKAGLICVVVDGEKVFDEAYFRRLGGDPENLLFYRPKTAEQLIKVLQLFTQEDEENPGADFVLIDSVASLLPQEELAKDVEEGDDRTAGRARMMSRLLRRVTAMNDDTVFLWTNQLIDKVGGYGGTTTPGGRALRHYTSIRVEFKKLERVKKKRKRVKRGKFSDSEIVVGHWVGVRAEKNKTDRPERDGMLYFDYDRKIIDPEYEIIHLGLEDGLIKLSGRTYTFIDSDGEEWSGVEHSFRKMLREEEVLREELVWAISENTRQISVEEQEEEDGEE